MYIALFVIFTYSYRYKNEVKKLLIPIIFTFSYLLSIYSILLPQLKSTGFSHLIPIHGYQLIYPSFGSHNHLGDFLILPLAICFYKIILRKGSNMYFYFLSILFFLPYFIFSFSRSAYLSLVLIVILIVFHQIKSNNISLSISRFATILLSLGLSIILLLSLSQVNLGPFKGVANTISNKHQLNLRDPLGYRDKYLNQGIQSISKRPFFGVGPSNFIHASKEYSTQNLRETYTAHNIFIEIVVENGIFAGLIFILIILLCIKNAKKDIYFFLGLALLINFQTDYTYLIYPMLILFVILLGVSYSENENRISNE